MAQDHAPSRFERALDGADPEAFGELLEEYLPRVRAFVDLRLDPAMRARESASDLVQSVCRQLVEELPRFENQGEDRFRGWLFTTALNKVREKYRYHHRDKRDLKREVVPLDRAGSQVHRPADYSTLSPSGVAMQAETVDRVRAALDRLPPDYREAITLDRLVGLPHAEIARQMGRSVGAVRMLLGRALIRFQQEAQPSTSD